MAADEVVLGEDVASTAACSRDRRPVAALRRGESSTPARGLLIAGMSVGLAAEGFRRSRRFNSPDYLSDSDQIVNHARLRNRTRGLTCPMALRARAAGRARAGHHLNPRRCSRNAGLARVILPRPARRTACCYRHLDPARDISGKLALSSFKERSLTMGGLAADVSSTRCAKVAILPSTWGALTATSRRPTLAGEGVSTTVIDVATVKPLDMATILAAVEKPGGALCSRSAADRRVRRRDRRTLAEHGRPRRWRPATVAGYDTVMPLPRLETHYMPSKRAFCGSPRPGSHEGVRIPDLGEGLHEAGSWLGTFRSAITWSPISHWSRRDGKGGRGDSGPLVGSHRQAPGPAGGSRDHRDHAGRI